MDCPRCGTPNLSVARFCRRCGKSLEEGDFALILGAVNRSSRRVKKSALAQGRIEEAGGLPGLLDAVALGDVVEAFYEAARHFDQETTLHLSAGGRNRYRMLLEGAGVTAHFTVNWPYLRLELRGTRGAVRRLVRRVVARHGEEIFAARDLPWNDFRRYTGVDKTENRTRLLDLLG